MNPYDFVCIDWEKPPLRKKPVWHYQLVGPGQQKLYSGHIELNIETETALLIHDPHAKNQPTPSLRNAQGDYVIPGSSLKGMLRSVVETLGRGCLTLFDGDYEPIRKNGRFDHYDAPYKNLVPRNFLRCTNNNELCLSCRIFGMMRPKAGEGNSDARVGEGKNLFLGKVNIGDARASRTSPLYAKMHTIDLMGAHPHHDAFYLDETKKAIAGRKYYFHHAHEPLQATRATNYNHYIQPLDKGTTFQVNVDFVGLTADEFAALLLSITLEEGMRHKIGYAKPLGLGTVHLNPQSMTVIDYATRYTQPDGRGRAVYTHDEIMQLRDELLEPFKMTQLVPRSLQDLRRIWRWPADPDVVYDYPDYSWFNNPENRGKRLSSTP
jgi:CRISPR/Cas system CSM-associated protein Csm3 (group 7 of RAMP superfamily)